MFKLKNTAEVLESLFFSSSCLNVSLGMKIKFVPNYYLSTYAALNSRADVGNNNENSKLSNDENFRENSIGIQMLSRSLWSQIFKNERKEEIAAFDIKKSIEHLEKNGLWGKRGSYFPDVSMILPALKGNSLTQHFEIISEEQTKDYHTLLNSFISADLPKFPAVKWKFEAGWTKYESNGETVKVEFPESSVLVFDTEVCVTEGRCPTLACAVSNTHWYSWCSHALVDKNSKKTNFGDDLISFEDISSIIPKIVIGHNVSYDRVSIKEQYNLRQSRLRFMDTMSMHIAIGGFVDQQRALYLKNKNADKKIRLPFMNVGTLNNLKDVYKLYCKGTLPKEARNIFVKGSLQNVRDEFQQLMQYCAHDVLATSEVFKKLFPIFLERFPSNVTSAGMFEMGVTYLPITRNWERFISSSDSKYDSMESGLSKHLIGHAKEALQLIEGEQYKKDLWLWDLDWSLPRGRTKHLPSHPQWYRKLCKTGTLEPEKMSTSLNIIPKLFRLTWNGYPLHFETKYGWGYLKPISNIEDQDISDSSSNFPIKSFIEFCSERDKSYKMTKASSEKLSEYDIGIPHARFIRLPHKNGEGNNVGNPLAKDFLRKIEDNTLSSATTHLTKTLLETNKNISYWKMNRKRILSQMVVWLDKCNGFIVGDKKNEDYEYGAIIPHVVVAGTITRRAVERTWMTASNAYNDRIGSELKSMIEAPPGYHFVGADVDSQELWIASVLGDSYFNRMHGSTAFGWMTLQGSKSQGTDMHSRTAATAGISRDNAKIINYGRIYGAGVKFIQMLLKQFNVSLSEEDAKFKALKLLATTKGERGWHLSEEGKNNAREVNFPYKGEPLTNKQIRMFISQCNFHQIYVSRKDIIVPDFSWVGGSESHMFNCLESICRQPYPKTPVLRCRITRTLEPWAVDDDFITSRVNWVVQSSAVDYLHLMLVCMRWLMEEYKIDGRFSISIHDEVRYLVASEDRYRAALALHITNLLTRSFISLRLGLNDLPQSVAFFSGVDIDKVLRKEPNMDCKTPSNPDGLEKGYGIEKGETLDIYQVIEKTGGSLKEM